MAQKSIFEPWQWNGQENKTKSPNEYVAVNEAIALTEKPRQTTQLPTVAQKKPFVAVRCTRVINQPIHVVGQFPTSKLSHKAAFCSWTFHACPELIDAARRLKFGLCAVAQIDFVLLYRPHKLRFDRRGTSVDSHYMCVFAMHHCGTVLLTCVVNPPTRSIGCFATRVMLCDAVLCYCAIHVCRKLTNAPHR